MFQDSSSSEGVRLGKNQPERAVILIPQKAGEESERKLRLFAALRVTISVFTHSESFGQVAGKVKIKSEK